MQGSKDDRIEEETDQNDDPEDSQKRIPKMKAALLFGYNGAGYQGLQM